MISPNRRHGRATANERARSGRLLVWHCQPADTDADCFVFGFLFKNADDMSIKLWNWEKNWVCQQVFEGHTHYVMQIVINPKDNNTFASASLDRTIKIWQLGSSQANFTLEGHEKGVNCVDYYHAGDKPYLMSGADDRQVSVFLRAVAFQLLLERV